MITSTGSSVGIGTTSPNDLLEVSGGFIRLSASAGNGPQFNIYSNGQTNNHVTLAQGFALATDNVGYLYNRANAAFVFGTNNSERMRISASGNIGIGTTNTTARFNIQASANFETPTLGTATGTMGYLSANGLYGMYVGIGNSGNTWLQSQRNDGNTAAYNLLLNPNGGNVGIGTSSPGYPLIVSRTLSSATSLFCMDNATNSTNDFGMDFTVLGYLRVGAIRIVYPAPNDLSMVFYTYNGAGNVTERMRIAQDGWVTFQGNGNGWTIGQASNLNRIDNTGSTFRCLGTNNGFTAIAASAFNVNSDYRLKEDLKDFNNSLDILKSIKIYDFKWKDKEERNYGVIAHELQEVLPYLVYGEKDGMEKNGEIKTQGVDYSKLVPVLVKAIQELSAKVTALENK